MPIELRRSGVIGLLTAGLVVRLGWAESALAQGQLSPPPRPVTLAAPAASLPPATLPPAPPGTLVVSPPLAIPSEPPAAPSQVFPDGGFPTSPPAPKGGMPAAPTGPGAGAANAEPPLPKAGYAPPGLSPRDSQQAPGVGEFFRRVSAPMPGYVYQPAYYDTPGIGARALADYAPPGYQPRVDPQGEAPGVPEFTPLFPPAPITPEERDKFVTRGIFPGSFLVPGTNTSFRLRGFVRLVGIYDTDPIFFKDQFITSGIPVPQEHGQNFNLSARISRIGLETWTPTTFDQWTVHTFIDADFISGAAQSFSGGSNGFRLRNAWVDFGYFRLGQQNTVFQDSQAWPSTVDFAGPRGMISLRVPEARMTIPLADKLYWATGIEQPFSDITTNGLGQNVQDVPDFATHLRYESDFGHAQLSSVFRSIGFQPTDGSTQHKFGWGVSASGVVHPWALLLCSNPVRKDNPTGLERSRILVQYNVGQGIGRNIDDLLGIGLDGQVDPVTGQLHTVYASGWTATYEHWFNEKWLANVTYSGVLTGNAPNQPGNTYVGAKYLAVALWFIPVGNLSTGIEYLWGERKDLDGQRGKDNRINALLQYDF
jgi:hypothetical protein